MKLFDCFCFFNEIELLELRLAELADTVDYFVIAEANVTHTGQPKPFLLERYSTRLRSFWERIVYVQVVDAPAFDPARRAEIEHWQREGVLRGLQGRAGSGDKVLLSDLDEIPRPAALRANVGRDEWLYFRQDLYYYFVNCRVSRSCGGSVLAPYGSFVTCGQLIVFAKRRYNYDPRRHGEIVGDAGWHYSWMGGPARIAEKARSIWEADKLYALDMAGSRVRLEDFLGRPHYHLEIVDITRTQPRVLPAWLERYPDFYYRGLNEAHGAV